MKRLLITGAGGFFGQRFIQEYARDFSIVAVVRSSTKFPPGVEQVIADLSQVGFSAALPDADYVVHFAQSPHYRQFPQMASDIFQVNVSATFELLEYARKCRAEGFLLASTGSVYAPYEGSLLEANDVNPMDFYSASKIAAEKLCAAYESNFSIAKMRLFFPYGEQQQDKLIVNLIENLKKGKPVQINGPDGGMKLTPTYIADICSIFRQSILENWNGCFNIATDEVISMELIIDIMAMKLGVTANIERNQASPALAITPDISKLRQVFTGFEFTTFDNGLGKILEQ